MVKTTPWKEFTDHGQKYRIQATYGIDYDFGRRHSQSPSFGATAVIERWERGRWSDDSCGMQHDEIAKHFPQLTPYLKWHLVSLAGPLHYLPNGKYWWEMSMGKIKPPDYQSVDPRDAFQDTIVFGGVPGESMPYTNDWADVEKWLRARLPKLMGHFAADMSALGVLE
jgi:hypothetical protein